MRGKIGKQLALFLLYISKNQHKISAPVLKKNDNQMLPSEQRNSLKQTGQKKPTKF